MAGIRVGYLVANKKIIDDIKSIKPIYEINGINVKIIDFFLKNLNIMKKYVLEVNKSRKEMKKKLKKYNVEIFGDKSNTVMLKFLNITNAKPIYEKLLKSKFLTKPVKVDGNDNYLRVTLGSRLITSKFIQRLVTIIK